MGEDRQFSGTDWHATMSNYDDMMGRLARRKKEMMTESEAKACAKSKPVLYNSSLFALVFSCNQIIDYNK